MRIRHITAQNFARLADLNLNVRGHLVLIGANDVGKTSLLHLLNLTLGPTAQLYQMLGVADLRDSERALGVTVQFEDFNDSDRRIFTREIDVDPITKVESLEIRLEVAVDPEDLESVVIQRWAPGRGEVRNLSREQLSALGWRYLPALRQTSAAHFDGASGAIRTLLRAVEPELGDEKKAMGGLLDDFNARLASSETLTALREGMAEHLSNSMPRAIGAGDLAVRTSSDPADSVLENVSMFMSRNGTFVPLSEQSDGVRQLVSMTLFDLAEGGANVIAIDEPELHLHPSSQRTVAELLARETNQKILVTHSPYIVQKFDPIQVVTVRGNGEFRQIDPNVLTIEDKMQAHWWSPRMLETLTARFAIVVEGIADRLIVEGAAQARGMSLDRLGAVVFELDGADKFPAVYKLIGPKAFDVEVLGLVDKAEQGSWLGAVKGKPNDVLGHTIFVSETDLEDEYCRAFGPRAMAVRLIASGVARDMRALTGACGVDNEADLNVEGLAKFCRTTPKNGGNRKVPSALAVTKGLTKAEAAEIVSVAALLDELERRAAL
ncbi:DUF2813 domain-containing protein [Cryobacterium algoricola]|uniref:DUF2813 domain-containing protein n=1 Tax=Cryobacterium algoricola TaxID=1259183 RepID=A0ABY2IBB5_9MICO|nr:AAA family ATPase [Cryobacterium algoricola]TFB86874.1 DUF2813 domain-containing protein [Cryobacterium algoricola]